MNEEWRDIEGYEGLYQVSNMGNIRSLDRVVIDKNGRSVPYKGTLLSATDNGRGYLKIALQKGGRETRRVLKNHRIVAQTFIPSPYNKPEVNHKNCIKTDNRVENLEWVTESENTIHALNNGLKNMQQLRNIRSTKIAEIDKDGNIIRQFKSIKEASEYYKIGFNKLSKLSLSEKESYKGYYFKRL